MDTTDDHCEELVADCRLRAATDLFAHTWDPVVIVALRPGPQRSHELRAAIGGISDKVLTETLRRLLARGLIARHPYAEAPPRVEYVLTRLGQRLADGPMHALGHWDNRLRRRTPCCAGRSCGHLISTVRTELTARHRLART